MLVLSVGSCAREDDVTAIRQLIREGARLAEEHDIGGLIELTTEDYEALALRLALNPSELKVMKQKLAVNLTKAPLFDTKRYTRHLEAAYSEMIRRANKGLEPDHINVANILNTE